MLKRMLKNEKGLTLIELLAVIVILGIVAAIAVPSIGGIIQKSKEDGVKADALQVLNAAKIYVSSNGAPEGTDAGKVTDDMLADYVKEVDLKDDYYVMVNGGEYKLTGEGTAGDVTIEFKSATTTQIKNNKDKATSNKITIGTTATTTP